MIKSNFLKSTAALVLGGGLFLTPAMADRRYDSLGHAALQLEQLTGSVFETYRCELRGRGIGKLHGAYKDFHERMDLLERQGDNFLKQYRKGQSYHYLGRVLANTDANVHRAIEDARHLRFSRATLAGLYQVKEMVHSLTGLCSEGYRSPRVEERRDYGAGRRYSSDRWVEPYYNGSHSARQVFRRIF